MRSSPGKLATAAGAAFAAVTFAGPVATAGVAAPAWTIGPSPVQTFSAGNDAAYKLTVVTTTAGCSGLAAVGDNCVYAGRHSVVTPSGGTTEPSTVHTS
ncbi:hypothetical protein [Streptomyces sp. NPDC060322]|uniref:hypothetical protein n=1 Tax=Streptomyces sp. NPDC060322 TaxID=3347097 RepID=UPI0036494DC2